MKADSQPHVIIPLSIWFGLVLVFAAFVAAGINSSREAAPNLSASGTGQTANSSEEAHRNALQYQQAASLLEAGKQVEAIAILEGLPNDPEVQRLLLEARYQRTQSALAKEDWEDAKFYLGLLPEDFKDTAALRVRVGNAITKTSYEKGLQAKDAGDWTEAVRLFEKARDAGGIVNADLTTQLETARSELRVASARQRLEIIRADMTYYSVGPVRLAVNGLESRRSIGQSSANENRVFIVVHASVWNVGLDFDHANPNNFTLSTPDGYTVPVHRETYGLSRYFDAVDLSRNQKTSGWLVFYLPKADTYILRYRSFAATTTKEIATD